MEAGVLNYLLALLRVTPYASAFVPISLTFINVFLLYKRVKYANRHTISSNHSYSLCGLE